MKKNIELNNCKRCNQMTEAVWRLGDQFVNLCIHCGMIECHEHFMRKQGGNKAVLIVHSEGQEIVVEADLYAAKQEFQHDTERVLNLMVQKAIKDLYKVNNAYTIPFGIEHISPAN